MTTELDDIMVPLAYDLLQEFGKSMQLTHILSATYSTSTGVNSPSSSTQTVKGLVEEYADNMRDVMGDRQAGTIVLGDKKITFAASGLTYPPEIADKIVVGGVTYNVVNVSSVYSGEEIALYMMQVRKQ